MGSKIQRKVREKEVERDAIMAAWLDLKYNTQTKNPFHSIKQYEMWYIWQISYDKRRSDG